MFQSVFGSLKDDYTPHNVNATSAKMMKNIPTIKTQVRSRLQSAMAEAGSAPFLNQLMWNSTKGKSVNKGDIFKKPGEASD